MKQDRKIEGVHDLVLVELFIMFLALTQKEKDLTLRSCEYLILHNHKSLKMYFSTIFTVHTYNM